VNENDPDPVETLMRGDDLKLTNKLVASLYTEAMVLADEARSYFDQNGKADREALGPVERVQFSCESLRVTTRLMHAVSWLLTRKAVEAGELSAEEALHPERRLGSAGESAATADVLAQLPEEARTIILASRDLYSRVQRLDAQLVVEDAPLSPARQLLGRLESSL
jgi:regulator of CtrA degradation|tara:strand:+ start:24325 stop:24822 length:498 start_codon:yes stop_codon:yes gene_type:complete